MGNPKDSSLFTGAGTPWGAGDQKGNTPGDVLQRSMPGVDWDLNNGSIPDIKDSALYTGSGTPWGAENKTNPYQYATELLTGPGDSIVHNVLDKAGLGGIILKNPVRTAAEQVTGGIDLNNQERINAPGGQVGNKDIYNQGVQREQAQAKALADQNAKQLEQRQKGATDFTNQMAQGQATSGASDARQAAKAKARKMGGRALYGGQI